MVGRVALIAAAAAGAVQASTIYSYLFEEKAMPPYASESGRIAAVERERIADLVTQVEGVVCFLPTNSAWSEMPGAVEALVNEPEGNVRYDMLLAACAAVPPHIAASVETLRNYADENGGVMDSAYGSSYTVLGANKVCQYEWAVSDYQVGMCAEVVGDGKGVEDGGIYYINKLIMPEEIRSEVQALIDQGARRRRLTAAYSN